MSFVVRHDRPTLIDFLAPWLAGDMKARNENKLREYEAQQAQEKSLYGAAFGAIGDVGKSYFDAQAKRADEERDWMRQKQKIELYHQYDLEEQQRKAEIESTQQTWTQAKKGIQNPQALIQLAGLETAWGKLKWDSANYDEMGQMVPDAALAQERIREQYMDIVKQNQPQPPPKTAEELYQSGNLIWDPKLGGAWHTDGKGGMKFEGGKTGGSSAGGAAGAPKPPTPAERKEAVEQILTQRMADVTIPEGGDINAVERKQRADIERDENLVRNWVLKNRQFLADTHLAETDPETYQAKQVLRNQRAVTESRQQKSSNIQADADTTSYQRNAESMTQRLRRNDKVETWDQAELSTAANEAAIVLDAMRKGLIGQDASVKEKAKAVLRELRRRKMGGEVTPSSGAFEHAPPETIGQSALDLLSHGGA